MPEDLLRELDSPAAAGSLETIDDLVRVVVREVGWAVEGMKGSAHLFENAWRRIVRDVAKGQPTAIQAARPRLLSAFEKRLRLLQDTHALATWLAQLGRADVPDPEVLWPEIVGMERLKARVFDHWQTVDDLEDLAARDYPLMTVDLDQIGPPHRPPASEDADESQPESAAVRLVPTLLSALESACSPGERRQLFRILTELSNPAAVLESAFHEYNQTGREAFLLHAVSLLEAFGKRAWPALLAVAVSGRSETELFLGLIARCPGVSADERSKAFRRLAKHAPPSVRLALLEHLAALGLEAESSVLREMAQNDPDETVRVEADGRLSVLTGHDS